MSPRPRRKKTKTTKRRPRSTQLMVSDYPGAKPRWVKFPRSNERANPAAAVNPEIPESPGPTGGTPQTAYGGDVRAMWESVRASGANVIGEQRQPGRPNKTSEGDRGLTPTAAGTNMPGGLLNRPGAGTNARIRIDSPMMMQAAANSNSPYYAPPSGYRPPVQIGNLNAMMRFKGAVRTEEEEKAWRLYRATERAEHVIEQERLRGRLPTDRMLTNLAHSREALERSPLFETRGDTSDTGLPFFVMQVDPRGGGPGGQGDVLGPQPVASGFPRVSDRQLEFVSKAEQGPQQIGPEGRTTLTMTEMPWKPKDMGPYWGGWRLEPTGETSASGVPVQQIAGMAGDQGRRSPEQMREYAEAVKRGETPEEPYRGAGAREGPQVTQRRSPQRAQQAQRERSLKSEATSIGVPQEGSKRLRGPHKELDNILNKAQTVKEKNAALKKIERKLGDKWDLSTHEGYMTAKREQWGRGAKKRASKAAQKAINEALADDIKDEDIPTTMRNLLRMYPPKELLKNPRARALMSRGKLTAKDVKQQAAEQELEPLKRSEVRAATKSITDVLKVDDYSPDEPAMGGNWLQEFNNIVMEEQQDPQAKQDLLATHLDRLWQMTDPYTLNADTESKEAVFKRVLAQVASKHKKMSGAQLYETWKRGAEIPQAGYALLERPRAPESTTPLPGRSPEGAAPARGRRARLPTGGAPQLPTYPPSPEPGAEGAPTGHLPAAITPRPEGTGSVPTTIVDSPPARFGQFPDPERMDPIERAPHLRAMMHESGNARYVFDTRFSDKYWVVKNPVDPTKLNAFCVPGSGEQFPGRGNPWTDPTTTQQPEQRRPQAGQQAGQQAGPPRGAKRPGAEPEEQPEEAETDALKRAIGG